MRRVVRSKLGQRTDLLGTSDASCLGATGRKWGCRRTAASNRTGAVHFPVSPLFRPLFWFRVTADQFQSLFANDEVVDTAPLGFVSGLSMDTNHLVCSQMFATSNLLLMR